MGEHLRDAYAQRDVRAEYERTLRQRAGLEPVSPGVTGDPLVSRVLYALHDVGVRGRATAQDVLDAAGGAGLDEQQRELVLAAIAPIPAPEPEPPEPPEDEPAP